MKLIRNCCSRDGHPGVKANLKAIQGDFFLLEKYIFFVSKQPTLVELSDVHQVVFSRVGASTAARTFDLKIVTKSGPEHTFTSLNKEEHEPIESYLKDKKIKIKNEMVQDVDMLLAAGVVDDEDEEMQSVASSDDEPSKPRLGGDDEDSEEGQCLFLLCLVLSELLAQMRTSMHPIRTLALHRRVTLTLMVPRQPQMQAVTAIWHKVVNQRRRKWSRRRPKQGRRMRKAASLRRSRRQRRMERMVMMLWTSMRRSRDQSPSPNRSRSRRRGMTMVLLRRKSKHQKIKYILHYLVLYRMTCIAFSFSFDSSLYIIFLRYTYVYKQTIRCYRTDA